MNITFSVRFQRLLDKLKMGLEKKLDKTEFILREVKARFKNAAVLWSTGKDSTACLHMIKNLFGSANITIGRTCLKDIKQPCLEVMLFLLEKMENS